MVAWFGCRRNGIDVGGGGGGGGGVGRGGGSWRGERGREAVCREGEAGSGWRRRKDDGRRAAKRERVEAVGVTRARVGPASAK